MPDNDFAHQICRLITYQRGIVHIARLLDEGLENGDRQERQFSSGEFLEALDRAISSDENERKKGFSAAEAYLTASFNRVLDLGGDYHRVITTSLEDRLVQAREKAKSTYAAIAPDDTGSNLSKAKNALLTIGHLKNNLRPVSDDDFVTQLETGIEALGMLVTSSRSIISQINIYGDRVSEAEKDKKLSNQNRTVITLTVIGIIVALLAGVLTLAATTYPDQTKEYIEYFLNYFRTSSH